MLPLYIPDGGSGRSSSFSRRKCCKKELAGNVTRAGRVDNASK